MVGVVTNQHVGALKKRPEFRQFFFKIAAKLSRLGVVRANYGQLLLGEVDAAVSHLAGRFDVEGDDFHGLSFRKNATSASRWSFCSSPVSRLRTVYSPDAS